MSDELNATTSQTVLLLGGTGRTGQLTLKQLLSSGVNVRAVVRSASKLPADILDVPQLTVVEADLLSLTDEELRRHLQGCDGVISCLGHVPTLQGVFGQPRDLVARATANLCRSIEALRPAKPVKFVLMSSVSVHHPAGLDTRRGGFEKATVWMLRGLLPPAKDNQLATDFLYNTIGESHPFVEWVSVRPDTLLEGEVSAYALHETLVSSLFAPDKTNIANVAKFMCDLIADPAVWKAWRGKLPVIVNS